MAEQFTMYAHLAICFSISELQVKNSSTFIRLNVNLNPVDTHWLNFGTKMDIFPVNEAVVEQLGKNIFSTSFSA